jgi:hypothetical protein
VRHVLLTRLPRPFDTHVCPDQLRIKVTHWARMQQHRWPKG